METVRVVSSGQVYRQMFDAQVQLTQNLKSAAPRSQPQVIVTEESIPVVRKTVTGELLEPRQKTWCHSFSNNSHVENPILYRQVRDYVSKQFYFNESDVCAREVLHLPDIVKSTTESSGIIERVNKGRRKKHEAIWEDMLQAISGVSVEIEPKIKEICDHGQMNMLAQWRQTDAVINRIQFDEDLVLYSINDLENLWQEVADSRVHRRTDIQRMKDSLVAVETDRMDQIRQIFSQYGEKLEDIAYLPAPGVHRLLDTEAQAINQTVLSNKRAYSDVFMRMISADIEAEKKHHSYWIKRIVDWRKLKRTHLIKQFRDFMQSEEIHNFPIVVDVQSQMKKDLSTLGEERLELINSLKSFHPPHCSKADIYKWNQHIIEISQQIDAVNHSYTQKLHTAYETICQLCLDEINRIRNVLEAESITTIEESEEIIASQFLPQIGEMQTHFEQELEHMDNYMDIHTEEMAHRLRLLYLFSQGIAHIWDTHEIDLAKQERLLKEQLDEERNRHNTETKERETILDTFVDKLRQDSKEKVLAETLRKCKDVLTLLGNSYESFYQNMCLIVQGYPEMVTDQMSAYENNLCLFFGLRIVDSEPPTETNITQPDVMVTHATPEAKAAAGTEEPEIAPHAEIEETSSASLFNPWTPDQSTRKKSAPGLGTSDKDSKDDATAKRIKTAPSGDKKPRDTSPSSDKIARERSGSISMTKPLTVVGSDQEVQTARDELALREIIECKGVELSEKKQSPRRPSMIPHEDHHVQETPSYDATIVTSTGQKFYVLTEERMWESLVEKPQGNDLEIVTSDMSYENLDQQEEEQRSRSPDISTKEKSKKKQESDKATVFVAEHLPTSTIDDTPELWYLQVSHISKHILLDIKKIIRMNFLEYLDGWRTQCIDRARSVLAAKKEELWAELDLRLHIHAPRAQRIELDIHNVRAAEVVLHSDRVKRHVSGIEIALANLGDAFTKATEDHNVLAGRFKSNVEALEHVFVNATKSNKLVILQNEVGSEMKKYMTVIRASLREFRKYLDETLQTLRESNARFIKSFRTFSDGGNFSQSELDHYRHKLEKISHQIDRTEGEIMQDLESMESKRLDQAMKIATEFEGRFKHHMLDLLFMEKIARWLTNTQVKIKAEVSNSNSQARTIANHIKRLKTRIDACEQPHLDKEQITAEQLDDSLVEVFTCIFNRANYLNGLILEEVIEFEDASVLESQYIPSVAGTKVGFVSCAPSPNITQATNATATATPGARTVKQTVEDPAIAIIRNILQKEKAKTKSQMQVTEFKLEPKERHRTNAAAVTQSFIPAASPEKPKGKTSEGHSIQAPVSTDSFKRRPSRVSKWDRRFLVFGDELEDEPSDLIGLVNEILRKSLDSILTIADVFYKQKGIRLITRPQALQENFDKCSEAVITKLLSYQKQTETYHNQCLQEFRKQTYEIENIVPKIPSLVINNIYKENVTHIIEERDWLTKTFKEQMDCLDQEKAENMNFLRPTIGHPQNKSKFDALCSKELQRQNRATELIVVHMKKLQENLLQHSGKFMSDLCDTTEKQLRKYDELIVIDDLIPGDTQSKRYGTSELIRRNNLGLPLEREDEEPELPRGKGTWAGLPVKELVIDSGVSTKSEVPVYSTSKTTLGHSSTISARDSVYEKYKELFSQSASTIKAECENERQTTDRWTESWNTSVERIKQLY